MSDLEWHWRYVMTYDVLFVYFTRLFNAATRLVSDTRKFDRGLKQLMLSTFIGSTCRNKWSSSSCRWCITAFITRLPGTWRTTTFKSLMWPVDDIFVLPGVITSLCLDTVSARMGVGYLLLSAQLPGTHWAMICVIRHLALTVSDVCLKLGCFQSTCTHTEHHSLCAIKIHSFPTWHVFEC